MGAKYTKTVVMDEGQTWVACNPIPGTGINYTAVATFSTVAAMFTWANVATAGGKSIVPDKIRLISTTAPTMGVAGTGTLQCAVVLDVTSRAPSAANSTIIPSNAYAVTAQLATSVATFNVFNANQMTVPTWGSTKRIVGRAAVPISNAAIGDSIVFSFGVDKDPGMSTILTAFRSTAVAANYSVCLPPVAIGPGGYLVFHLWMPGAAATTIPAYEYEVTWWEV